MKEEFGDEINDILNNLVSEEKEDEPKPKKISKITSTKINNDNLDNKPKISSVKITSKTINKQVIETDNQVTGEIEQSLKDKYKNRKK